MADVLVVGAGPGGSTTAALMARRGLDVTLIDKESFPRDKICGDAISGKSVDALKELDALHLFDRSDALGSWGVTFSSPAGDVASIPFGDPTNKPHAPGFVCSRLSFDETIFNLAVDAGARTMLNTTVKGLLRSDDGSVRGVHIEDENGNASTLEAPLVVGADGAYSVVSRELGLNQLSEKHYCAGLRSYYTGVTGFNEGNFIEIHFVEESIPGYFWIFPMSGGRANVGIGMLSSAIKKGNVRLKPLLQQMIEHPRFRHRFEHAERQGPVKGWGLPLGSNTRQMAGDGWMLLGDAASLIDPFTGEGIGNAMVSGMKAADMAVKAHEAAAFDAAFLQAYEHEVINLLSGELKLSHAMQRLGQVRWLLNLVIRKASRSDELADAISCMFDDLSERKNLVSPLFYLRVLFA